VIRGETLARLERAAIGVTPIVAVVVVAIGLRVGGGARIRGVKIQARGPGHGRVGLAWQMVALGEEGGVREVLPATTVDLVASARGASATWRGVTNADGVAEAWLDLPGTTWGDPVTLRATAEDGEVLADGTVAWPREPPASALDDARAHATRVTGDLAIEVFLRDGKLVPGFPERAFVRVTDAATRKGMEDVALTFAPEPGLSVDPASTRTAAGGWSEVHVTAEFLLAGWTVEARGPGPAGRDGRTGSWYGALPVAPGAAAVALPQRLAPEERTPLTFVAPAATHRLYVEVDDAWGCDFAAAVDMTDSSGSGATAVSLPALAPGAYWLVTSSDPHGAESLTGTTLARPFEVGGASGASSEPDVVRAAAPFTRFLAVDGLARPLAQATRRRRRGLMVALAALLTAAALEVVLVLRAAARARIRLARLSEAAGDLDGPGLAPREPGGVTVLVLVTVLGFALMAGLMMLRE
jgi:hypothetical protein